MTNLLKQGVAWLGTQLNEHAASQVTVSRAGESDLTVNATVGETTFRLPNAYGFETRTVSHDFLILAADYKFGGAVVEPQAGDSITDADGDIYAVLSPGDEPDWRYSDVHKTTLRIYTKLIETA